MPDIDRAAIYADPYFKTRVTLQKGYTATVSRNSALGLRNERDQTVLWAQVQKAGIAMDGTGPLEVVLGDGHQTIVGNDKVGTPGPIMTADIVLVEQQYLTLIQGTQKVKLPLDADMVECQGVYYGEVVITQP